jgi:predicted NBD/HSP70 family sugar kinase
MTAVVRRSMNLGAVRRHHLSMLLESLLQEGPASRAVLARRIGVTKATASALVADLAARCLIIEGGASSAGTAGRPGVEVAAAGWSVGALGLQIEVDRVVACVVDLAGAVRIEHRVDGDNRRTVPARVLGRVEAVAKQALAEAGAAGIRCVGGALAIPGLVDPSTRALFVAPNLHWLDVDLTRLDQALGFELGVDNEANLGALAELRAGAAVGLRTFVYVSGGVGIGGGLVIDGALVRGVHGFAGEIGHVVVDPNGPQCACGSRGCLEAHAGTGSGATPEQVARALTVALRSVVHLVDPQAIILGGDLAASAEVTERVAEQLRQETLGGRWRPCEVRRSILGTDAAAIGAAATVLNATLADPTLVPLSA